MSGTKKQAPVPPSDLRWAFGLVVALTGVGVGTYFWLLYTRWGNLASWGAVADAVGPFAGLFSAIAVLAALRSVELQRQELAENRKVLEEQADHQERTALAQERLAASQERLAAAQEVANKLAARAITAQLEQAMAGMDAAYGSLVVHALVDNGDYLAMFEELCKHESKKDPDGMAGRAILVDVMKRRERVNQLLEESRADQDALDRANRGA